MTISLTNIWLEFCEQLETILRGSDVKITYPHFYYRTDGLNDGVGAVTFWPKIPKIVDNRTEFDYSIDAEFSLVLLDNKCLKVSTDFSAGTDMPRDFEFPDLTEMSFLLEMSGVGNDDMKKYGDTGPFQTVDLSHIKGIEELREFTVTYVLNFVGNVGKLDRPLAW